MKGLTALVPCVCLHMAHGAVHAKDGRFVGSQDHGHVLFAGCIPKIVSIIVGSFRPSDHKGLPVCEIPATQWGGAAISSR